jgi:sec-independent protein translocase protein TatA
MPTPGPLEIIVILVIVLVIFGPKRLPDLGRSLGRGMREFKDSVTGKDKEREEIEAAPMTADEKPEPAAVKAEPAAASAPTAPREQNS